MPMPLQLQVLASHEDCWPLHILLLWPSTEAPTPLVQVLAGYVDSYFQRHPISQDTSRHLFTSASFTDLMGSCPELAQKLILMVTTELKPTQPSGMYPFVYPGEQLSATATAAAKA